MGYGYYFRIIRDNATEEMSLTSTRCIVGPCDRAQAEKEFDRIEAEYPPGRSLEAKVHGPYLTKIQADRAQIYLAFEHVQD